MTNTGILPENHHIMKKFIVIYRHIFLTVLGLALVFLMGGCASPDAKKIEFCSKGEKLLEKGETTKAKLEFKNAIQMYPEFATAHYLLCRAELELKNLKAAFKQFSAAVRYDPAHVDATLYLAKMLFSAKNMSVPLNLQRKSLP